MTEPPLLCMTFTVEEVTVNAMHSQTVEERVLLAAWGLAPSATRGPRARYDVAEITAAAVALADDRGLPSVSLYAVAGKLGLTTTALYRYVVSKEMLVQLMIDTALGPPPDVTTDDWRDGVQTWVHGMWGRYQVHPWLAEVRVSGRPVYPQRLGWLNSVLCELDRGRVSDPLRIALLLDGLTRSFALLTRRGDDVAPPAWVIEAAAERYPRLAREFSQTWTEIEDELAPAVAIVLAGAQRVTGPSPGW